MYAGRARARYWALPGEWAFLLIGEIAQHPALPPASLQEQLMENVRAMYIAGSGMLRVYNSVL